MIFHDVPQGEDSWFRLRLGIPTASCFDRIVTPAKGQLSAQADAYIADLIGERFALFTPAGAENYTSRAMQWGRDTEPEARRWYEMERNVTAFNGGFCTTDDKRFGSSPDGLVGEILPDPNQLPGWSTSDLSITFKGKQDRGDGLASYLPTAHILGALQLKRPQPGTQVKYVMNGSLPVEYRCQVHGHLIVTGLPWVDFCSYCPGLPSLIVRVEPDEFTDKLRKALDHFHDLYAEAFAKFKPQGEE